MAVTIAHAAAKEDHCAIKHRLAPILHGAQGIKEVRELSHDKGIALGQSLKNHGIAVVMGKVVASLRDADFRDGQAIAFTSVHVRDHARHISAQCQHDQIKHGAPVFAGL